MNSVWVSIFFRIILQLVQDDNINITLPWYFCSLLQGSSYRGPWHHTAWAAPWTSWAKHVVRCWQWSWTGRKRGGASPTWQGIHPRNLTNRYPKMMFSHLQGDTFSKASFLVSYGIHVDFGGCSSLWPFQRLLYCGWPQTIKLGNFESPCVFIWAVHIATRIFRLRLCCFIWHHDSV